MPYDISVIVPIYNAEKYLDKCLNSILAQTKDKIEIVLVNDGSTDSSSSIIRSYLKENNNITYVEQENKGLTGARITGLRHSSGKYIGWVDADDFIKPEMYQVLYSLAEENEADYVYCDYEFYPEKVPTKEKWFKEYTGVRDWNYIDRNTQCWNTISKRDLLMRIDLCDTYLKFGEYSWISVMLNAKKPLSTNEKLYFYRVGNDTMSGGTFIGKLSHFRKGADISKHLEELLVGTGYENKLKEYMNYRYIYTLLQLEIVAAVNKDKETYIYAEKELKRLRFRDNPYTKSILNTNHGLVKSYIIRNMIPSSFLVAKLITSAVF